MKAQWLFQTGQPELIVFFNGWGMDSRPLAHLHCGHFDVLELHAYTSRTLPAAVISVWPKYRRVQVIAWSLGVWMAHAVRNQLPPQAELALAVNGTLQPLDARFGIAPSIFQHTLETWSPEVRGQFYANMFSQPAEAERFLAQAPMRECEDQRRELLWLQTEMPRGPEPSASEGFSAALIGQRDLIIPAKNQIRFWRGQCPWRVLACGHFPFYAWQRWEDLLQAFNPAEAVRE
jgi:pimeloyl-[acyl-carrier protein] methyl ester esterase